MEKTELSHIKPQVPSLQDVQNYWNQNPVHSVEFKLERGADASDLKRYLDDIDRLRWSDNEKWAAPDFYDVTLPAGAKVLDAGCGIGVFTRFYARKGYEVTAVDLAERPLQITRESLNIYGLKADVRQASVESLPFPDNSFDFIVSNGVIHHTENTENAVREFHRVLKPGGRASVAIYYKNSLLRQPIWPLTRFALKLMLKKREGRKGLLDSLTPEDFAKAYDGDNTPIARIYTVAEADQLFSQFKIIKRAPHYFPVRFLKALKPGGLMHEILDRRFGTLIYYMLEKQ